MKYDFKREDGDNFAPQAENFGGKCDLQRENFDNFAPQANFFRVD